MNHKISDLILLSNNQFFILNKPSGLPVITSEEGAISLHKMAMAYCKKDLHLVHRIDQPVSGIVVFAKQKTGMLSLSKQFEKRTVERTYLAVTAKCPEPKEGKLVHYLRNSKEKNKAYAFDKPLHHTKEAQLEYKWLCGSDRYQLLQINLHSGRHHQIRTQLGIIGSPVKGDVKYGAKRGNKDRSIELHAWKITFQHPVTKEKVSVEAPLPTVPLWQFFKEELAKEKT